MHEPTRYSFEWGSDTVGEFGHRNSLLVTKVGDNIELTTYGSHGGVTVVTSVRTTRVRFAEVLKRAMGFDGAYTVEMRDERFGRDEVTMAFDEERGGRRMVYVQTVLNEGDNQVRTAVSLTRSAFFGGIKLIGGVL